MNNSQDLNLSVNTETTFKDLGLSDNLVSSLEKIGFTHPTSVQALTIPYALQGRDVLGSARTGTGKTLAFGLPLVTYLINNPNAISLILVPTRELAQQVSASILQVLEPKSSIKMATLIGGEAYFKQFSQLRLNPRIIVGTPGRVIDHMERRSFKIDAVKFFILDETDRMFDMGFSIQLEDIMQQLPKERQTLMFSATFPPKIEKLASTYLIDPKKVFVDAPSTISKKLTEETIQIKESEKYTQLCAQLDSREGTIIIFVKTKMGAENLADDLRENNHNALAIHGDLKQEKRERLIQGFRKGRCRIMVATDVASRGLDIPHIQHVINYDIPHCPEDYIHRIGRTARAGASGNALNFVSSQDDKKWKAILKIIDPNFVEEKSRDRVRSGGSGGRWSGSGSRQGERRPSSAFGAPRTGARPSGDRFGSPRPSGDRFASPRPSGDRFASPRPSGDRFASPRPSGDRFASPRPSGDRFASPRPSSGGFRGEKEQNFGVSSRGTRPSNNDRFAGEIMHNRGSDFAPKFDKN